MCVCYIQFAGHTSVVYVVLRKGGGLLTTTEVIEPIPNETSYDKESRLLA